MPEWLQKIISSKSKTFLAFCFCFILGVVAFSFVAGGKFLFYLYITLFVILFFIIILWHKKRERFLLLCLLFFIFGGLRFLISIPGHNSSRIEFYNGRKVTLQGWISAEPDIGVSDAKYIVSVKSLDARSVAVAKTPPFIPPLLGEGRGEGYVSGKVIIKTRIYPEYHYGDELEITCSLLEPENFDDSNFNYRQYLAKRGVWSVCSFPAINDLNNNKGNFLLRTMFRLKDKVETQMSRLWPEPESSLVAGILYGRTNGLPKELIDNFSRTGVSHIIAVSGYNVSIIAVVLNIALIYIGLSRRQSFWFLIFLILSFVFFTGATASVVRAGVMAIIILISQHVGRLSAVGRALVYAAVIMLLLNPYLLVWDAGFQLSFLSTLGLVYLSPIIQSFVDKKLKTRSPVLVAIIQVFITTISAIIATMPLAIYQFERFSIAAPLVNILILWLVPWLMLFGFISLIFSFIFFPLGQAVAWAAGLGLNYVIIIVDWFGGKSWSAADIRIPTWIMLVMYLVIIYFVVTHIPPFIPPPTAMRRGPAEAVVKGEGRGEGFRS